MSAPTRCAPLSVLLTSMLACVLTSPTSRAEEPKSGPAVGSKIGKFEVFDVTGPHMGKSVDYPAERKEKPTVYVIIREFDRPVGRYLKTLDSEINNESSDAHIVAVWVSEKPDDTKEYLPKAQQSLKLERTSMTVFAADQIAEGWNLSSSTRVTVVVAVDGKVVGSFAYDSVNDTLVPEARRTLKKALEKPAEK